MEMRAIAHAVSSGNIAVTSGTKSSGESHLASGLARLARETSLGGLLVVNGDDWGRDTLNTNRILECI
jgi:hypothetical protein